MSAMDDRNLANASDEKAKRREKQNFYDIDNIYFTFNDTDKRRAPLESTPATFHGRSVHQQKVDIQSTRSKS